MIFQKTLDTEHIGARSLDKPIYQVLTNIMADINIYNEEPTKADLIDILEGIREVLLRLSEKI